MKRKFTDGSRVIGKEGDDGKACFRGRTGTVVGYLPGSGYLVRFDDGPEEYVYAHWLEALTESPNALQTSVASA